MAKQIKYSEEARASLEAGVNALANSARGGRRRRRGRPVHGRSVRVLRMSLIDRDLLPVACTLTPGAGAAQLGRVDQV